MWLVNNINQFEFVIINKKMNIWGKEKRFEMRWWSRRANDEYRNVNTSSVRTLYLYLLLG